MIYNLASSTVECAGQRGNFDVGSRCYDKPSGRF